METLKLIVACFGGAILLLMLIEILTRPSEIKAMIMACNFVKKEEIRQRALKEMNCKNKSIREQALEDYIKCKEKASAAYADKLSQSDYKEIEGIIITMSQALSPLVEKRNRIINEAMAEYKKIMEDGREKSRKKFRQNDIQHA